MTERRKKSNISSCGDDQEGFELSASDESEPEEELSRAPFDPELDDSDDGGEEACALGATRSPASTFVLSGGNSAFSDRSRSVFDCLDGVERQTAPPLPEESMPPPKCPPPAKKRGVPDYLLHPDRWTRYSLEDVKETTDQENRRAAHNFLSSLRPEEGNRPPGEPPPHDQQQKVVFSKPKRAFKEEISESDQQGKEKRLHLSHLAEEEEEDNRAAGKTQQDAEEDRDQQESLPSFTPFKKMKRKSYRRSSDHKNE
uniref:U5 small nuclear ribonucleoprotein TSSC4 n=1 Tax=Oryzias latipes TaxID=8090 RepID=A0A3P9HXC1_ORYLA